MRSKAIFPLLVIAATLLAGCMGGGGPKSPSASASEDPNRLPPGVTNRLEGLVQGPDLGPLLGVLVEVGSLSLNNTTNEVGYYRIDSLAPGEHLVTAAKDGYRPQTQRVRVEDGIILELNFRLDEIPLASPFNRTTPFTGFISCQAHYQTAPDRQNHPDCGSSIDGNNKQHKDFDVMEGASRLVVELQWTARTPAARVLTMRVTSLGDNGVDLASDWGESVLKFVVPPSLVQQHLKDGGVVRVRVDSGPSVIGEESAVDAGLAFQQDYKIYFTVFHVEPGPASFSAVPK